ncbi:ABC transporter permease [Halovivax gelatinilyticus]|uniref:ABC transporter permease n=1 Tax=Halovivax gelatinilyticus TaxID=2961597 RepID=UPI0020CA459F|nr:ABC transporter permease [Halovivax gelatinilyticus]
MVDVTDVTDEMFEDSTYGRYRWLVRPVSIVGVYALMFASIAVWYDPETASRVEWFGLDVYLLEWISLLSVLIVVLVVGPAVARRPTAVRRFLVRFARDRVALVALLVLCWVIAMAFYGEFVVGREVQFDPAVSHNPPVGFSAEFWIPNTCVGTESDGSCYGTLEHPLGTDRSGRDISHAVTQGILTSLQVGVSTAVIAGGLGTVVGVTAGTLGGRVDDVLMRLVDVVTSVPAFFAYVLVMMALATGRTHVLLVLLFGLFSWGGFARLVRSEVLRVKTEQYVESARAAGAGNLYVVRYHVLPNVTTGVFVPIVTLVPIYMLAEAALSYLDLLHTHAYTVSLGEEIADGFDQPYGYWWYVWWDAVVPAVALTLLILCIFLVGDRINELVDPRES